MKYFMLSRECSIISVVHGESVPLLEQGESMRQL